MSTSVNNLKTCLSRYRTTVIQSSLHDSQTGFGGQTASLTTAVGGNITRRLLRAYQPAHQPLRSPNQRSSISKLDTSHIPNTFSRSVSTKPNMVSGKAVVTRNKVFVEETIAIPALDEHEVLVRVHYAAFNPTDALAFNLDAFGDGAVLGCDLSGTVEELGKNASRFSKGDKVAAFIWGGEKKNVGAYSQYCIIDERIAFPVPSEIGLDQAATLPLAVTTAFLALFSKDCLKLEQNKATSSPVLILGGSSTVGAFANQIAKIHGIETISTASKKNFEAVSDSGAKAVFNYHDSDVVSKIQKDYPEVDHIFDTIGTPASSGSAGEIIGSRKGQLCTVRPGKVHTENIPANVKVSDVFVFTCFPHEHSYRGKGFWPINWGNFELAKSFSEKLGDYLASGKIKPRPVRSMGKLSPESVTKAVELQGKGEVSNEKMCFTVIED